VQPLDAVHPLQIGVPRRAQLRTNAPPAGLRHAHQASGAELRCGLDHFVARRQTWLAARTGRKSHSSASALIFASTILISIAVSASAVEAAPNTQAAPFKT
jgi:hypothetical protein